MTMAPCLVARRYSLPADRRRRTADRREAAAEARETAFGEREAAAEARETALGVREAAADVQTRASAHLRRVNERLVLTTLAAQARVAAAEQVSAAMSLAAQHDELTGLANRALLAERLQGAIRAAKGQGHRLALLFVDLDRFKQVNDSLGHQAGDQLLKSITGRLLACVRLTDTVCRQGGDEFVLLLPDVRDLEDALLVARKVIAAMAPAHPIGGQAVTITLSIGICLYPDHGAEAGTLLDAADMAMYQIKREGGDGFGGPGTGGRTPLKGRPVAGRRLRDLQGAPLIATGPADRLKGLPCR
jgi:diguanylate cyclase (GGDEF)-like protein